MPRFRYVGSAGQEATLQAESLPAALRRVQAAGDRVVRIREEPPSSPRITEQELATFYRQLASMLEAGLPLVEGLQILARDTANPGLREVCYTLYLTLAEGGTLVAGLEKFPDVFPRLHVALARAGDRAGLLPTTLGQTADYLERIGGLGRRFSSALVYPAVVGVIVLGLISGYWGLGLVPKIMEVFNDLGVGDKLPLFTRVAVSFANHVFPTMLATLLTAGVMILFLRAYYRTRRGRYRLDRAKLWLPFVGQILSKGALGRFCRTLGLLLRNEVEIESALALAGDASGNAMMARAARTAAGSVLEGAPLAPSLAATGLFPRPVTDQIASGEKSGSLLVTLDSLADFSESQADHFTRAFSAVIEPLLIIVLGIAVATTIVGFILPLLQVIGSLTGGMSG